MNLKLPATLVLAALLWAMPAQSDEASTLFQRGREAERQGDDVSAYLLYSQARTIEPENVRYVMAASAVRRRAAEMLASLGQFQSAIALDPSNAFLLGAAQASGSSPSASLPQPAAGGFTSPRMEPLALQGPPELQPGELSTDFQLQGSIRSAYQSLAERFGLIVIFDQDFDGQQEIKFQMDDVDFSQAMLALNDVARAFLVPVNERVFLIADDTVQKRNELEPMATAVFPLTDLLGAQQVTEVGQAVQQVLEIRRFQVDSSGQQVVIRDTVSRVRMAQALLEHLARPRAEAVVEVDLVTIEEDRSRNIGIGLPTSFPVTNFSTVLWNAPPQLDGSVPLLGVGGGGTVFGVAIGSAALVANQVSSAGTVRSSFSVRATDGTPASFLVGERFPIVNARFSAAVIDDEIQDEIDAGTLREPFPSFTFEDLGLVFNVTPRIHSAREVSLEIETEVKQLTGRTVNDIPVLSNRRMQSYVRLRAGEVALITGMAVAERRSNRSGPVFLSEIPVLGWLFRRHTAQVVRSHMVLVVKPRIVRLPPSELLPELTLRYGPEARPLPPI